LSSGKLGSHFQSKGEKQEDHIQYTIYPQDMVAQFQSDTNILVRKGSNLQLIFLLYQNWRFQGRSQQYLQLHQSPPGTIC